MNRSVYRTAKSPSDDSRYREGEMEHAPKTRLMIVDDQRLFAENLKSVLEFRSGDFEVVGIASNGRDAVDMIRKLEPELVLMDIRMPLLNGVQVTKIVHEEMPQVGVVVLTTFDDEEYISDALDAGAMGYILKDIPFNELLASLRAAREGTVPFSPEVVNKLVKRGHRGEADHGEVEVRNADPVSRNKSGGRSTGVGSTPAASDSPSQLTAPPAWLPSVGRREREIMKLISSGMDNTSIASELFISEQTVKNYVYGIYSKLGEHNRVKAAQIIKTYQHFLDS